jgi:sialic acid synthase SpsE
VYAREILHPASGLVPLPGGDVPLYQTFRALECSPEFYAAAASYARARGVRFMCSPFGAQSLDELFLLCPDAVKIASPELNHVPLLKHLAGIIGARKKDEQKDVRVVVSTGVSKLFDIENALDILGGSGARVTLLHCVTAYPAPEDQYNLRLIGHLGGIFGVDAGVSDHSLDPVLVPALSVCAGASFIEKHITLSRNAGGLDDPIALDPASFGTMCRAVRQTESDIAEGGKNAAFLRLAEMFGAQKIERVMGTGVKRLARAEEQNYGRTNRSIHYTRSLKKGQRVTQTDIAVLRTEKILEPGIHPKFYEFVQGKELTRDVRDGDGARLEDFCC